MDIDSLESGTYELVGPKVQNNRYNLPQETVLRNIVQRGKVNLIPVEKHYFIRHGIFEVNDIFNDQVSELSLDNFRRFILDNSLEGLVFHFSNNNLFKINRGHIGQEIRPGELLNISLNK